MSSSCAKPPRETGAFRGSAVKRKISRHLSRCQPQQRNISCCGDGQRGTFHALLNHQRLGVEIRKIEIEFFRTIGGIERCGGGAASDGDKRRRHLRSVGQHNGHPVAPAYPHAVQGGNGALRQIAQTLMSQSRSLRRADGRGGIAARRNQSGNGAGAINA